MRGANVLLIVIGAIIFFTAIVGGGLLFVVPFPYYPYIGWFVGIGLVAVGLWLNEKDKK